jgi:hypothetical protein
MQRSAGVVVGALFLVLILALVLKGGHRSFLATDDAGAPSVALASGEAKEHHSGEGGILDDPMFAGDLSMDGGLFVLAPTDAEPASPLPSSSPKMVRFGVILIQYRGAQGAPAGSRSREEAVGLARSVGEAAKADFKGQVSKGDPGSMDDAGRIPRGVLEPAAEYALFTLAAGGVSDPIDTPRGFWIVKRIE